MKTPWEGWLLFGRRKHLHLGGWRGNASGSRIKDTYPRVVETLQWDGRLCQGVYSGEMEEWCRHPGRYSRRGIMECPGTLPTVLGKLRQGTEGGRRNCFTLHCGFQQQRLDLRTSASDAGELSGGNPCQDGPVQRAPSWLREGVIDVSFLLLSTGGCNQREHVWTGAKVYVLHSRRFGWLLRS